MTTVSIQPRTERRRQWPVPVRIEALEQDADDHEAQMHSIHTKLDRLNVRATGVLVGPLLATVALVGNLVVMH